MSNKPLFVFDCDEVLCDFVPSFLRAAAAAFPELVNKINDVADMMSFSHDDMEHIVPHLIEQRAIEMSLPMKRATETVQLVRDLGATPVIMTARGWHPNAKELTIEWCARWDLGIEDVIVVDLAHDKAEVINRLNNVIGFVDDSATHIRSAIAHTDVPNLYLFDQPWNQGSCTSEMVVTRVHSHNDLQRAIRFNEKV